MIFNLVIPSEGSDDAIITAWHYNEGDSVNQGDLLCEVETGKTSYSLESPVDGKLIKILCDEGEEVPATEPIAHIEIGGNA